MRMVLVFLLAAVAVAGCNHGPEPEHIVVADWSLPNDEQLNGTTAAFTALLTAPGCTDGVTEMSRVVGPDIEYTDDAVVVSFRYRLPGGPATCPLGPPLNITVRLPEPLGGRELLDGALDPPSAPPRCDPQQLCGP